MKFWGFPLFLCSCGKVADGRQTPHHFQPLLDLPFKCSQLLPPCCFQGCTLTWASLLGSSLLSCLTSLGVTLSETLCCFSSLFHRSECSFHNLSLNMIPAATGISPAPNTCRIVSVFHKKPKDTVGPVFLLLLCKEQNRKISTMMLSCFLDHVPEGFDFYPAMVK